MSNSRKKSSDNTQALQTSSSNKTLKQAVKNLYLPFFNLVQPQLTNNLLVNSFENWSTLRAGTTPATLKPITATDCNDYSSATGAEHLAFFNANIANKSHPQCSNELLERYRKRIIKTNRFASACDTYYEGAIAIYGYHYQDNPVTVERDMNTLNTNNEVLEELKSKLSKCL